MTDPTPDVDAAIGGPILYATFAITYGLTRDINKAQSILRDGLAEARDEWTIDELQALLVDNIAQRVLLDEHLCKLRGAIDAAIALVATDPTQGLPAVRALARIARNR